jgi:hypothetical protein
MCEVTATCCVARRAAEEGGVWVRKDEVGSDSRASRSASGPASRPIEVLYRIPNVSGGCVRLLLYSRKGRGALATSSQLRALRRNCFRLPTKKTTRGWFSIWNGRNERAPALARPGHLHQSIIAVTVRRNLCWITPTTGSQLIR